jgi:hypothetical protein
MGAAPQVCSPFFRADCRSAARSRSLAWAAGLLCLAALPAMAGSLDAELAYVSDNNAPLAARDQDILRDHAVSLGLAYELHQSLASPNLRMVYRAQLRGERYAEYSGLSNVNGGITATLQYRPSARLLAPTFGVFGKVAAGEYESKMRNSTFYSGGVSWQQSLTDRLAFSVVVSGTVRDSDSLVFDTREGSFLVHVDQRFGRGHALYFSYNYLAGDIVSTGTPYLAIIDAARVIEPDDAFGGLAASRFAYQLDARTQVGTLGLSLALLPQHTLDLSVRYVHADADGGLQYDRTLASVAYLVRF